MIVRTSNQLYVYNCNKIEYEIRGKNYDMSTGTSQIALIFATVVLTLMLAIEEKM